MAESAGRQQAIELVRTEMVRRSTNPTELARDAGLGTNTVADLVNGKRWPRAATLGKLEAHLGWPAGRIDRVARGVESPEHAQVGQAHEAEGVFLDVDPSVLSGLSDEERDEALTATKLALLQKARELRGGK